MNVIRQANLSGRGVRSCAGLSWPAGPVGFPVSVLRGRGGGARAHGNDLIHAEQAQYPGDGGLRANQFHCAAAGLKCAVSLHECLDGGGIGEAQIGEVNRKMADAGGDLHIKCRRQFRGLADV